jgi:pimeloyl-ACP methyl ester carboxylesterase
MTTLNLSERGNGPTILLIHGFPFHQQIWNSFADKLSETFHVITIDLPGLGKSPLDNHKPPTLDKVAETVLSWTTERKLNNITLLGHSLGGYVALAMINLNPSLFNSLILFHSTAYADNEEKKQSRNKVLEFIRKNGVEAFTSNFIPPLYSNQQHPSIDFVRQIAVEAKEAPVMFYTEAMRDRKDRTHVLQDFPNPILFIGGEKDGGIPPDSIHKQALYNALSEVHILPDVAHMGMFENESEALRLIQKFILKSNRH